MKKKTTVQIQSTAMLLLTVFFIVGMFLSSCQKDSPTSLYDQLVPAGVQPVIDSIAPSAGTFAGLGTLSIYGKNFSTSKDSNYVYFDLTKAAVVSATTSLLVVKSPILVKDSIKVKVAVFGSDKFSVIKYYKLTAAVEDFGGLKSFEGVYSMTCDQAGNLYAALSSSNLENGIRKFTPTGDSSTFIPRGAGILWSAFKMGPGGLIYACRNNRAIYTIAQNASPTVFAQKNGAKFFDLDFDKYLNVWTGGADTNVYRIKPDKSIQAFLFNSSPTSNIRTVRVFKDFLYCGGKVDSTEGVWRAPIDASGNVGAFSKYFDLSAQPGYGFNGFGVFAITFTSDGDMFIGTDSQDAILIVRSGKTVSEPFYSGLFTPKTLFMAWGQGSTLYVTRSLSTATNDIISILKVNTQRTSAPYYGRGDN